MTRLKCAVCGSRPAVSAAMQKCEVCLYREEFGTPKTDAQVAAAEREREERKRQKAKRA